MAELASLSRDGGEQRRAAGDLLPVVYENLRHFAAKLLGQSADKLTLQPTALVNEAFVRLTGSKSSPHWESPEHFFAAAARAMRSILVDAHRRKDVFQRLVVDGCVGTSEKRFDPPMLDLIALDDALNQLTKEDSTAAQVVEFRFFVGLTLEQTAKALDMSRRTVSEKWDFARAWLLLMLEGEKVSESRFSRILAAD